MFTGATQFTLCINNARLRLVQCVLSTVGNLLTIPTVRHIYTRTVQECEHLLNNDERCVLNIPSFCSLLCFSIETNERYVDMLFSLLYTCVSCRPPYGLAPPLNVCSISCKIVNYFKHF
jgi:hypothetical protein